MAGGAAEAACILDARAVVAESPVWCAEEQALYWTDIYAPSINRLDPATGENRSWPVPAPVGCLALREGGGVIAAGQAGFFFLDLQTGKVEPLHDPEPDRPNTRLNDGRCDRAGRFWAGSMDETLKAPDGALYRFDPDRNCRRMVDGVIVSNGLAFSPDDRIMYHADTRRFAVYAYDFDLETGTVANKRVFVDTAGQEGRPDGAAVDEEGCYWSARYGGWGVVRHAPDGREIGRIDVPVAACTMVAFGGPDLDRLYITTASQRVTEAERKKQPRAGGLFVAEPGVRGLPEPRFAG
jgi:L-arabinonolactonase